VYSVLIVDDEEPVLDSFSYLIESALDDFQVGGTARSGSEAIRIARDSRPDVVLMDIAMPGIDGIDTIRELQHEYPDSLYIVSTAYERFDLAQRAIPLRVFAYLVKPVSKKRFMETLFRAKDELDAERERLNQRLEEAERGRQALDQEIRDFMLLLTWKPLDLSQWSRYRHLFQLSGDHGLVAAVQLDHPELYRELAQRIERRYRTLWSENQGRMLLFVSESVSPSVVDASIREHARDVAGPAARCAVSVGSRRRYDELYLSCDEALKAMPAPAGSETQLRSFRERVRRLSKTVATARGVSDAASAYDALSDEVFKDWTFHLARNRIAVAFDHLLHDHDARLGRPDSSLSVADPVQDLIYFETRKEVDAWAQRILRRLVEEQLNDADSNRPAVLREALQYIAAHYAEPLQLTGVAEVCSVSAGYLSRLFSQHLDLSFNDYLNSVRLERARLALEEGKLSIKEIAYSVGYRDPNYFSRIFKKFTGSSPSEFSRREGTDDQITDE
jgi:two-component system response regulator YesN